MKDADRDVWTLLTSHGHVLVEIARNPTARIRDLAAATGITERAVTTVIADLESAGYVTRQRVGRRNHYTVHLDLGFRHPAQRDVRVGPFLKFFADLPGESGPAADQASRPASAPPPRRTSGRRFVSEDAPPGSSGQKSGDDAKPPS